MICYYLFFIRLIIRVKKKILFSLESVWFVKVGKGFVCIKYLNRKLIYFSRRVDMGINFKGFRLR